MSTENHGGLCRIWVFYRGSERLCAEPATHFVTYFQDGSGGVTCCDKHLAKAVHRVLTGNNASPDGTAKVRPFATPEKKRR
jgi:hypothetical protein